MRALIRILRDPDAFERRILLPLCVAGAVALPILIFAGAIR